MAGGRQSEPGAQIQRLEQRIARLCFSLALPSGQLKG